ncbi:MAG: hypothetical protein JO257_18870 [Deltaproteobacteria bacterium]|nr:hypothetical protein [Deltaproteobacteria bacterium]
MSRKERIDAFEAWLRARGNADELALFSRSVTDGMLSMTGGGKLEPIHVEHAAALARDAGMSDASVAALGALLLEFEAAPPAGSPAGESPPAESPAADSPLAGSPLELEPAPFGITLRAAESASTAASPPEPAPADGALAEAASTDGSTDAASREPDAVTRSRRGWIGYAAGVVVAGGLVVVGLQLRGRQSTTAPATATKTATATGAPSQPAPADNRVRLRRVPLFANVPRGWHEASDAELLPADAHAPPMSLVYRGGSAADPERGMFVSVLPAAGELAGHPADAALIRAAGTAERGLGAAVTHGAGGYVSAGCTVVSLGGVKTGACVGTAQQTGATSEVGVYVRVIGDREIVAVAVTRQPSAATTAETAALVASLTP